MVAWNTRIFIFGWYDYFLMGIHTYIICFSFVVWNPQPNIHLLLRAFAHEGFIINQFLSWTNKKDHPYTGNESNPLKFRVAK
jgi:hypothetical protein